MQVCGGFKVIVGILGIGVNGGGQDFPMTKSRQIEWFEVEEGESVIFSKIRYFRYFHVVRRNLEVVPASVRDRVNDT